MNHKILKQISGIRTPSLLNPCIPDLGGLCYRQPTGKIVILSLRDVNSSELEFLS